MIAADNTTGITSSAMPPAGNIATSASSPSARNPEAKWAIGDSLITTGFPGAVVAGIGSGAEPEDMAASSHHRCGGRDLTSDLCGGYRRRL
ncbi:hypothetical protein MANY_03770 [Mycolicibacterium anyangense]|uniref:Uncharacterized protein n=1 Tax=Mycolicibacterium anyangense TaxID=1431246 RepID=A0A6N4VZI9_9MYCO|nr:hypothetical protein MANY_03770 [Mycolicibacterium anyangense]